MDSDSPMSPHLLTESSARVAWWYCNAVSLGRKKDGREWNRNSTQALYFEKQLQSAAVSAISLSLSLSISSVMFVFQPTVHTVRGRSSAGCPPFFLFGKQKLTTRQSVDLSDGVEPCHTVGSMDGPSIHPSTQPN